MAGLGSRQSEPVGETVLRRVGGYRCCEWGTYCTPRIDASRGMAPAGGRSRSWAERWSVRLAGRAGRGRLKLPSARARSESAVADRVPRTPAELEVRRGGGAGRVGARFFVGACAQCL